MKPAKFNLPDEPSDRVRLVRDLKLANIISVETAQELLGLPVPGKPKRPAGVTIDFDLAHHAANALRWKARNKECPRDWADEALKAAERLEKRIMADGS